MTKWERRGLLWLPAAKPGKESPFVRLAMDKIGRMTEFNRKAWDMLAEVFEGPEKRGEHGCAAKDSAVSEKQP